MNLIITLNWVNMLDTNGKPLGGVFLQFKSNELPANDPVLSPRFALAATKAQDQWINMAELLLKEKLAVQDNEQMLKVTITSAKQGNLALCAAEIIKRILTVIPENYIRTKVLDIIKAMQQEVEQQEEQEAEERNNGPLILQRPQQVLEPADETVQQEPARDQENTNTSGGKYAV